MNHSQNRYSDNRYSDGDPGPSRTRVPQGEEEAQNDDLPDHSHLLPFIPTNYFLNAPLRIYNPFVPSYASTSFLPSMPSSDDDGYIIAPCTPSPPPSVTVFEPILDQEDNYILAPCTPPETTSDNFGNFGPTFSAGTVSRTPMKRPAIFEDLHHSFKRRKLSASNLQEMVDHINIDLDDYDIEDYDRGLPAYIYDLHLPLSESVRKNMEKAQKKIEARRKKSKSKREAVQEEARRKIIEKRRNDPNAKPCPSCGQWDHQRSSNKLCPQRKPGKAEDTGLKRRSTIKTSIDTACTNELLRTIIQETVLKCRNLRYIASLFANFLALDRIQRGEPLPTFGQPLFYNIFCQLVGKGQNADQWIKDLFGEFRSLSPAARTIPFYADTAMISEMAREYNVMARQHVVSNFEKRSVDYFFLRLNESSDSWFLENASVKERKKLAEYMYKRAASQQAEWPVVEDHSISRAAMDARAMAEQLGPTPITEESLSAHANLYLPWMAKVLDYVERRVVIQEPRPQNFVSKQYVHRNIKQILKGLTVPQKSFDSLVSLAHNAIESKSHTNFAAKKLRTCTPILSRRPQIEIFVTTTIDDINAGTFRPAKYTDPKGCRRFTLFPVCSMQAAHIQLDRYTLPYLTRRAGLYTGGAMTEEHFRQICWQNFDFQVLGIESIQDLSQERMEFSNILRTDGVDLEFIFLKPKHETVAPKTPAQYRNWLLHGNHRCTIWGIDPGVTDLFVAADGSSTNSHRFRSTSTKEYYHLCGFNRAKELRQQLRQQTSQELLDIIDNLESLKTANFDTLQHAIQNRIENFDKVIYFYDIDRRYRKLKFKSYQGKQKGLEEIGRRLTYGSKKYGAPPKPRHSHMMEPEPRRRQFWIPSSSCDKPEEDNRQHYIFAFGNGACGGIAGKLPAPVKRLRRHLYQLSNRNVHTSVLVIDEYNTSKVCAECHTKSLVNLEAYPKSNLLSNVSNQTPPNNQKRTIHAILKCTSCRTVWNRDKMAAKNIRFVFQYMATHNDERPAAFARPPTNAEDDAGPGEEVVVQHQLASPVWTHS